MKLFGEIIKTLRTDRNLPLRKVAAFLDIDTSLLSKIERGERSATIDVVIRVADFFSVDEKKLVMDYYSDQIAEIIYREDNYKMILSEAECKVKYIKSKSAVQKDINFENE